MTGPSPSTNTLPGLLHLYQRRMVEAEQIGATAPVAGLYGAVIRDLGRLGVAPGEPATPEPATLLTVQEAAERLGVPKAWLYRRVKSLPFARKLGPKTLRFDPAGLARYLAARSPR